MIEMLKKKFNSKISWINKSLTSLIAHQYGCGTTIFLSFLNSNQI